LISLYTTPQHNIVTSSNNIQGIHLHLFDRA
jgi:hypothetical protein